MTTAEVVAEAEGLRRVVDAVMALEEPYRETVLLRWFQDLSASATAGGRFSVPGLQDRPYRVKAGGPPIPD